MTTSMPGAADPQPDSGHVMTLYGQAMTRAGSVFAIGMAAIVPFGILSVAVTTRYLDPADYGRLAILFAAASSLTLLAGIGFTQGTLISAYGMVDDDGDGDGADFDDLEAGAAETSLERRRLLASGFLIVIVLATLICGLVAIAGATIGQIFFSGYESSIAWMAGSAWSGAIWRLAHQVPRMERKAARWSLLQFLRPGLVLAVTLAALIAGLGLDGVLMATMVGTILSTFVAYAAFRSCYHFAFRRADVSTLWKKGRAWVPLTIAVTVQSNVNILVLALLATPTSVGLFQVASRIAQLPSYFADGFLTGWPAMERSQISIAAKERKGVRDYSASAFTLFWLSTVALIFVVSVSSDFLIHIAAPSFESAAGLIPIVAAAFGAQALFRGVFRATSFPKRRYWFTAFHLIWIVPYAGVAALLIPLNASYGVAIAQLLAGLAVSAGFVVVDRRGPDPTPFQWPRLGIATILATLLVVVVQLLPASTWIHTLLAIATVAVFPLLLILTKTVTRQQVGTVKSIVAAIVPSITARRDTGDRLTALPEHERKPLELIACEGRDPPSVASGLGVSEQIVFARVARGLRQIAGGRGSSVHDHLIGSYLLETGPAIERDVSAAHLRAMGVDPLELHSLDLTIGEVSRLRRRRRGPADPLAEPVAPGAP